MQALLREVDAADADGFADKAKSKVREAAGRADLADRLEVEKALARSNATRQ